MTPGDYVHGYSERESTRLSDQAGTLKYLLHHDTIFPDGSVVLEAGCGIGAQTAIIAGQNPGCRFVSIDISEQSLEKARERIRRSGLVNVEMLRADIFSLPFSESSFDHVFLCFVLEHLPEPSRALDALKKVLKPGGTLICIEGDHGSAFFHPENADAMKAIRCLVDLQAMAGGNSLIGRQLYPLLCSAGFSGVTVSPRFVYADAGRPAMVEGFTRNTFAAMVEGVRDQALEKKLIDGPAWERGMAALSRTAEEDGVFCYTFFRASAVKP
jgi:SAM-dependent methyltransferase